MENEELIDLDGAYEDLKELLINLSPSCVNCSNAYKEEYIVCKKCVGASFWSFDKALLDEIENRNKIEEEEEIVEPKKFFCPKCGEELTVETAYRLCSAPPKYETFCRCGYNGTIYCSEYLGREV